MFKDKVKAKFKAGNGGDGRVSFLAGKIPSGGFGGDGGDVYLEGVINIYDLSFINSDTIFKAENAANGGINNSKGKNGNDLIIKVPLITKVYDRERNLIISISKAGERKLLLKGGRGGLGNYFFRKKGLEYLSTATPGKPGETLDAELILELYSDIIFIGFPNAGKSSILNAITNAQSKVAAYAFTTLNPQLGLLNSITLMDLPGLIEGTAEEKGLGTAFVKHTRAARLVAHLISLETENVETQYLEIRSELTKIDPDLAAKPEVIILTKSDLAQKEDIAKKVAALKKYTEQIFVCSVYDYDSLEELKKFLETIYSKIKSPEVLLH